MPKAKPQIKVEEKLTENLLLESLISNNTGKKICFIASQNF